MTMLIVVMSALTQHLLDLLSVHLHLILLLVALGHHIGETEI